MRRRSEVVDAPEFPENISWLNVDRPPRLKDLRGGPVLVVFWTSCCINCVSTVRELEGLQNEFGQDLRVIGVHSAKCTLERETAQLQAAAERLGITFPVINDRDMQVWNAWEVDAWPTAVLVDPNGRMAARHRGDRVFAVFGDRIRELIRASRPDQLRERPDARALSPGPQGGRAGLLFPANILADEKSGRLFISDTNAHRIVVTDFDGRILEVAGSGRVGLENGSLEEAAFNQPGGAAVDANVLYVADRGNHTIRRVDFDRRVVQTIAGTGRPAPALMDLGRATEVHLHSPWDVEIVHHRLYITMAGAHQIWRLDLHRGDLEPYAGGGSAGFLDGSRANSLLAQPSGITGDGVRLFFTDAGSSALRWVYLPPGVQLGTWVGQGIFEYGDRDGAARQALLQYPQGVEHNGGQIYIADTYNNKIKQFNPRAARLATLLGTGEVGFEDGDPATFNEPRDVSCAGGRIWIADTNNHAIRVAPLDGGPVSTLHLYPEERLTRAGE